MEQITAGAISIFMSGDGQSIPFGGNWVSKIEGRMWSHLPDGGFVGDLFRLLEENGVI